MAVRFFNEQTGPVKGLKKNRTKEIIRHILTDFSFNCGEINVVFTSDKYLLEINMQFLKHNYYTDIITFPEYNEDTVSGDIYISIDRVRENAKNFNTGFINELMRVIVHGSLHLCGMKDTTKPLRKRMTEFEDKYLKISGYL